MSASLNLSALTERDRAEIAEHGIACEEVARQLALLADPPAAVELLRPCTLGDGILTLELADIDRLLTIFEEALASRTVLKFVPASGAASRMFKTLLAFLDSERAVTAEQLRDEAAGDPDSAKLLELVNHVDELACYEDVASVMAGRGLDPSNVIAGGDVRELLAALLGADGLDYAALPKGVLKFHWYDDGPRTPFEEHLVEAANYVRGADGVCRLHFTVSDEHVSLFERVLEDTRRRYEELYDVRFEVSFSTQKSSTDSVAVTSDNRLFRNSAGCLLFRPGGHGALIENLAETGGDIVFIKNVDNVVPDHLKEPTYLWKRVLGGLLVELQQRAFVELARVRDSACDADDVAAALAFLSNRLGVGASHEILTADLETRRAFAVSMLDRPLRVCGMVRNEAEPGGGPFWVSSAGSASAQIVEASQVAAGSTRQQEIFESATHFNPVDLVCALRDSRGEPYDLARFIDPATAFIVEKTADGRPLRAIERPGLWNGAMGGWNTVFVEVPPETFNPVKEVNDLLRKAHRALGRGRGR
jgi:hypothetical protein